MGTDTFIINLSPAHSHEGPIGPSKFWFGLLVKNVKFSKIYLIIFDATAYEVAPRSTIRLFLEEPLLAIPVLYEGYLLRTIIEIFSWPPQKVLYPLIIWAWQRARQNRGREGFSVLFNLRSTTTDKDQ